MYKILFFVIIFFALVVCFAVPPSSLVPVRADVLEGNENTPNYIINPSCRKNTLNISKSGAGTITADTTSTASLDGKSECEINAAASGETFTWHSDDMADGLVGNNCEVRFWYFGSDSLYKAYAQNADGVKSNEITLTNDGSYPKQSSPLVLPCGGTFDNNSDAPDLIIEATDNAAGVLSVSKVYSGEVTSIGQFASISDPISFTPTGSWVSNTTYAGKYAKHGSFAIIDYYVTTTGAPTSASLTLNLPSGLLVDTAKLADTSVNTDTPIDTLGGSVRDAGTITYSFPKAYYSTTSAIAVFYSNNSSGTIISDAAITQAAPMTWASGDELWIRVRVPISGWSASQSGASIQCLTNGQCENVFSAFVAANGTVSNENVDWINGNCTNATASVCTWNTSFFSATPTCWMANANTSGSNQTNINGGQAWNISTTGGTFQSTDATGSSGVAKDKVVVCQRAGSDYRIRAAGPILTGTQISPSASNAEQNIRANINCDASSSITSQNGSTTTGIASVGNRSSATCALTIATGVFSSTPFKCNVTINSTTVQSTGCTCASATSCTIAGPNADYDAWVDIAGPR